MKKTATLASVLLICLMLPAMASGMTQKEWNQKCRSKTSGTITLYAIEGENGDSATSADVSTCIKEIGSLPGGTYIVISGFDYDLRMYKVAYLRDSNVEVAWSPKESAIVSATTVVYFDDGCTADLPEALVADIDALLRHLKTVYPDRSYSIIDGSSTIHVGQSQPTPTPQPVKDPSTDTSGKLTGEWKPSQTTSEEELAFNADCPWRLKRTINGYSDTHMTKKYENINIGTYCTIGTTFGDVVKITYYKSGEKHSAYIERADLLGSTTQYKNSEGQIDSISQADPNYDAIVGAYEVTWLAESIQQDLDAQVEAERNASGKGQKSGSSTKDMGDGGATLEELGTHTSKVSYQGKTMELPTAELSFGKVVPEDKKLAVIYTPKTGKASLRRSASGNADVLKQCKAGMVVSVLEYGKTYCLINYKNTAGYILTDCLKFHGVAVGTKSKGILSYNGKVSGGTTINIRLEADGGSRKIGEFKTGTEVMVFACEDGWYEIEVQGIHGYVMDEFLVMNE